MGQYVVFKSHKQVFALPVEMVKRVIETEKFISLPEVPGPAHPWAVKAGRKTCHCLIWPTSL